MVTNNLEESKYLFTTKNILDEFKIRAETIPASGKNLAIDFKDGIPYLSWDNVRHAFEDKHSFSIFLQKLSISNALSQYLTEQTLTTVTNEMLQLSNRFNIILDKNTEQIITVVSETTTLVSWSKIIQIFYDIFDKFEEKTMSVTTFAGLKVSVYMNGLDGPNMDVLQLEPQSPSGIYIYRSNHPIEIVPIKGYDEQEILETLHKKIEYLANLEPVVIDKDSLVRD